MMPLEHDLRSRNGFTFRTCRLISLLFTICLATGSPADDDALLFSVTEHFGVDHPDQIIDFELPQELDPDEKYRLTLDDEEVAYQFLQQGKRIAVRTDLQAGQKKTWRLQKGHPTIRPTQPVSVTATDQHFEIVNGRVGVRVPKSENASTNTLAPIQGLQLADGTWTAVGPNLLNVDGSIDDVEVTFVERGPLKVAVSIRYVIERKKQRDGEQRIASPRAGTYVSRITVLAGQPSILFEEESDTEFDYKISFDNVPLDQARYRGHYATDKSHGYDVHGLRYDRHKRPGDAIFDLPFDKDYPSGHETNLEERPSIRRMAIWDRWAFDTGWYWQLYSAAADPGAPLLGIFSGRASRARDAGMSGTGIHTRTGENGQPHAGLTVLAHSRGADGTLYRRMRYQWGFFAGTVVADLGDPREIQTINKQANLHGGINLNKLHRLVLDFPDPPGGYGGLFMDSAALDWRRQKVRDDVDYYRYVYAAETQSRPLIDLWRSGATEHLDRMIDDIKQHAHDLVDSLVNGEGIHSYEMGYWHAGYMMIRDGLMIDQIMENPLTSPEDQRTLKAIAVLYASVLWDNDFVPLDNDHKLNLGTPNMPVQQTGHRNFYAMLLSRHPSMSSRADEVKTKAMEMVESLINEHGAEIGSPHYIGASIAPTLSSLMQIQQFGDIDPFAEQPRLAKFAEFFMHLMTPPEVRLDGRRGFIPLGDSSIEPSPSPVLGMLGTGFHRSNPELSARLIGMWEETGKPHMFFFGSTLLMIDERLPDSSPDLGDAMFPGYMSVLRNGYGTRDESAVWLIAGDWYRDHRSNDHGSVIIYALGQPLSNDWSAVYYPHTPGSYMKTSIVFADSIEGGWATDSPDLGVGTVWRGGSEQQGLIGLTDGSYSRATMKSEDVDPTVWTREVFKWLPVPRHPVIIVRDSFDGPRAGDEKVTTLNLAAEGPVITPLSTLTPITRRHPFANHEAGNPAHELPSSSAPVALGPGVHRFGFQGAHGVDFDVYTISSRPREALVGNWAAPIWGGFARGREEAQHILRVKDTGAHTTVIIPWRKGQKPLNMRVTSEEDFTRIDVEDHTMLLGSDRYISVTNGKANTRTFHEPQDAGN